MAYAIGGVVRYFIACSRASNSGDASGSWDFTYIHNGEGIASGHRILFSLELFSFRSIKVQVTEKGTADNTYRTVFPITCFVELVGKCANSQHNGTPARRKNPGSAGVRCYFSRYFLMASKVVSLITCSTLQASSDAVSASTPSAVRSLVSTVCRSKIFCATV